MRTLDELKQLQALPLDVKEVKSCQRIKEWIDRFGEEGVYAAISGGKDSTVFLHLVREVCGYKKVPGVFVDTGLEYPEIREFVKTFENIEWLKPKMNFKQVIEKYGYPFISKEVSECVEGARKYLKRVCRSECLSKQSMATSAKNSVDLENIPERLAIMLGQYDQWYLLRKGNIPREEGKKSIFSQEKYKFFLNAPFEISNKCCNLMKKEPFHRYERISGRKPMTAQMASESRLRTQQWINHGCNAFDAKNPISNPMSFWTEQDVLLYIKTRGIKICSVYGDIVEDRTGTEEVEGQLTISDLEGYENMGIFDAKRLPLKTTGCSRTGCMFCGYGCHLEKEGEGRFERMKATHPKQYEWIMRDWEDGGLGYRKVIDWINENGNLNIRY